MNSKVETEENKLETPLVALSVLLIVAGIAGFYYFSEQSTLIRVVGLLATVGVAIFIGMMTDKGKNIWEYIQGAQLEVRKVVWPTRQETVHTTGLVIVMVFIVALMLWLIDLGLSKIIGGILGHGG